MSEPEIAQRCPACGVSIREAALFCPQCGVAMPNRNVERINPLLAATLVETISETAEKATKQAIQDVEPRKDFPGGAGDSAMDSQKELAARVPPVGTVKASMGQAARGAVGAKIQRATKLARGVEGDVVHRARKVREMSGVVLDEAGYDPSLRFVLVAAILFILFLAIVLLNKFIT